MALEWHRRDCHCVALPVDYSAGHVRDSDPAYRELIGYEVSVGARPGVASAEMPAVRQPCHYVGWAVISHPRISRP